MTVLKAGSDKPEVVATNPKLGERTAATPAIADDALVRQDRQAPLRLRREEVS